MVVSERAKVDLQNLDHIFPVQYRFGNIGGGVFWRPIFNLLEDDERTLVLVNPLHMRAVPGRKTDVKDSEWLADLLRHGLVRPSFIPPAPIRELRELTRHR
jgi:transposase